MYVPSAGEHRQSDRVNVSEHRSRAGTSPTSCCAEFVSRSSLRVDDTRTELLPELVDLAEDEESSVRLAAFDTIINLMEMMDGGESPGRSVICDNILDSLRLQEPRLEMCRSVFLHSWLRHEVIIQIMQTALCITGQIQ